MNLPYYSRDGRPFYLGLVMLPHELLTQVLNSPSSIARKVFYCILAEDHKGDRQTEIYHVHFKSIHRGSKDLSRGKAIRDAVRREFKDKAFRVNAQFAHTYLQKNYSEDSYIFPFSIVDYARGEWVITLTREFKLYLSVSQEMNKKKFNFSTGDLSLLVGFTHPNTDKFYWLIRREQMNSATKTIDIATLRELLDKKEADPHNIIRQSLSRIKEELLNTSSAFDYSLIKKGQGAKIVGVQLTFRKKGGSY